jgi:succinyl-CoA synthetase beta subunit
VQICTTAEQVEKHAVSMLGHKLITKQTGPAGQHVAKVLVNEGIVIHRELYFAILMDRAYNGPVLVASTQGGMDIEEVAEKHPHAIIKVPVDIHAGLDRPKALGLAKQLGFTGAKADKAADQFQALYKLFLATDATQVEINPLAEGEVPGGQKDLVFAVDAKLNFDDNAAFRQKVRAPSFGGMGCGVMAGRRAVGTGELTLASPLPTCVSSRPLPPSPPLCPQEIYGLRDKSMEDPRDVAAEEAGLNYIGLDGNIGCMVNGAGLAMATMDIIKLHGGSPANFLDVGGGATAEQVTKAFKILTSDPNVKALLVNIFGGIMKCDTIANGAWRRREWGGGGSVGDVRAGVAGNSCACRGFSPPAARPGLRPSPPPTTRCCRPQASSRRPRRSSSRSRWWCAWRAPTWSWARSCCASRASRSSPPTTWTTPPRRRSRRWRRSSKPDRPPVRACGCARTPLRCDAASSLARVARLLLRPHSHERRESSQGRCV